MPAQIAIVRPCGLCWKTNNVDMGMVILTPQSMTDIEETAAVVPDAVGASTSRSSARSWALRTSPPGVNILRKAGIPNYPFPEDAVRSLAAAERLVALHEIPRREMPIFQDLDVEKAKGLIAEALDGHDKRYLTQAECRPLLECYRLPLLRSAVVADSRRSRQQVAESFGYAGRDESHVGRRRAQVGCRRRAVEHPRRRRSGGGVQEDLAERHACRTRCTDPGHSDRRDGAQGRGSDSRRQSRLTVRTADDVRLSAARWSKS